MDPRFSYPAHIPRHGDPSLNRLPHNFNMQVCKPNYTFGFIEGTTSLLILAKRDY